MKKVISICLALAALKSSVVAGTWSQNGFTSAWGLVTLTNCDGDEYHHSRSAAGLYKPVSNALESPLQGNIIAFQQCYPETNWNNCAYLAGRDSWVTVIYPDACAGHTGDLGTQLGWSPWKVHYEGTFNDGTCRAAEKQKEHLEPAKPLYTGDPAGVSRARFVPSTWVTVDNALEKSVCHE